MFSTLLPPGIFVRFLCCHNPVLTSFKRSSIAACDDRKGNVRDHSTNALSITAAIRKSPGSLGQTLESRQACKTSETHSDHLTLVADAEKC